MRESTLFSVIILHYNQPRYVKKAIDSVLKQSYSNIELIFADDASTSLDLEMIKDYINVNKSDNISNIFYSINAENIGTVKTLNRAISCSKGDHILFFAADDALCNEQVISNYLKAFRDTGEDTYMVSSQCYMMDIKLENCIENFVNPTYAVGFNKFSAYAQYKVFTKCCFLAIGSTAMRREVFDKFGLFNEKYKFVEDWSYFLHVTRNGGRIKYADFEGLLHRDGGVSHYDNKDRVPPHVLAYKYDMIQIFQNEIMPYLKDFHSSEIHNILMWYENEVKSYTSAGGQLKTTGKIKLLRMFPNFYIQRPLYPLLKEWKPIINALRATAVLCVIWMGTAIGTIFSISQFNGFFYLLSYYILPIVAATMITAITLATALKVTHRILSLMKNIFTRGKDNHD